MLLGLPLVLPTLRIVLLIGGAAFLLRMAGTLTGFLPNVPAGTTLLRLLCSRGMTRRHCQDYRSDRNGEPTIPGEHDAPSNIPMNCNQSASISRKYLQHHCWTRFTRVESVAVA
jgi:hypothetical protein